MKKKKGFTLVELLVVIAILAILATVSVVGYMGFTKKAQVSNDTSLVAQLNTLLKADEAVNGKAKTPTEVLGITEESGYDVTKLTPTTDKYDIVWNQEENQFALLDEENNAVYGTKAEKTYMNWKFVDAYVKASEFSIYLTGTNVTAIPEKIHTGLDVGNNTGITTVNYENTGNGQTVTIRTNGGTLNVNAGDDTVYHYGLSDKVVITAVADKSFHEYGNVKNDVVISSGRIVLENDSKVKEVKIKDATDEVKVESNVEVVISVDESSKDKTSVIANSDNIYVSGITNDKISGSQSSNVVMAKEINSTNTLKNAVENSGFYIITSDFTLTEKVTVDSDAKVIVDLNGKQINYANNWFFEVDGDLTIMDSVGTGKINVEKGAFNNLGILTLNGGEIEATTRSGSTIKNGADLSDNIYSNAKLIINDIVINTNNNYAVYNYTYFELNGGEIKSTSSIRYDQNNYGYCIASNGYDNARFIANGGTVTGIQGAIAIGSGTAEINNVTAITSNSEGYQDSYYALYVAGETGRPSCVVNGGYFSAGERQALYIGNKYDGGEGNLAACIVNDGTFVSPNGVECLKCENESENNYGLGFVRINGGKFSTDVSNMNGVKTCNKNETTGLFIVNA